MDWKGGLADGGGSRDDLGGKEGQPYPLAKLHPGKTKASASSMTREGWKYEESTLFERDGGYPAKRPWYPLREGDVPGCRSRQRRPGTRTR